MAKKPAITRCLRKSDLATFAKSGESIVIQGSRFIPPNIITDGEFPGTIITDGDFPDIITNNEGYQ